MEDLLGIDCNTNSDGSITIHQNKYIYSMINRFFTPEECGSLKKVSTPYSSNLAQLVVEALRGSTAARAGALMKNTRASIARRKKVSARQRCHERILCSAKYPLRWRLGGASCVLVRAR